jgi:hypothetical protein
MFFFLDHLEEADEYGSDYQVAFAQGSQADTRDCCQMEQVQRPNQRNDSVLGRDGLSIPKGYTEATAGHARIQEDGSQCKFYFKTLLLSNTSSIGQRLCGDSISYQTNEADNERRFV